MSTFYGGEQFISFEYIDYSINSSGGVNTNVYTVPAGYYASIQIHTATNWDTIIVHANKVVGAYTLSKVLLSDSGNYRNEDIKLPNTAVDLYDEGEIIRIDSSNASSQNPSTLRCVVYLYKKP